MNERRHRIVRRAALNPDHGKRPGREREFPSELERLVVEAAIRVKNLGERYGVMSSYEIPEGDASIIGGNNIGTKLVILELPLKSASHAYDASISTEEKSRGRSSSVKSDFDQLGNRLRVVHDRIDAFGRLIYRRVNSPDGKWIKDLNDTESIELMQDLLSADPDFVRIQALYELRQNQARSGQLGPLTSLELRKPK